MNLIFKDGLQGQGCLLTILKMPATDGWLGHDSLTCSAPPAVAQG